MSTRKPVHIEVTSVNGASKWVRDIVSHSVDEIIAKWQDGEESLVLQDSDGAKTLVCLSETYMIRAQDDEVFRRRSEYVRRQ
jgi:hypothetical protein